MRFLHSTDKINCFLSIYEISYSFFLICRCFLLKIVKKRRLDKHKISPLCYTDAPPRFFNPVIFFVSMKGLDCVLAMLGGAVVGAAVTLLLAPCSGKEMRKNLCQVMKKKGIPCCKESLEKWAENPDGNTSGV